MNDNNLSRPWGGIPSVTSRFARRPASVATVGEAIAYHRRAVADGGGREEGLLTEQVAVGNYRLFAQLFGLAHALWEGKQAGAVHEALAIARELLAADPSDPHTVRNFALDLSLETGDFAGAVALLEQFPNDVGAVFSWIGVLVFYKARGAASRHSTTALKRAMKLNMFVFPLLFDEALWDGDEVVNRACVDSCSLPEMMFIADDVAFGTPKGAKAFVLRFGRHFRRHPGVLDWMRDVKARGDLDDKGHWSEHKPVCKALRKTRKKREERERKGETAAAGECGGSRRDSDRMRSAEASAAAGGHASWAGLRPNVRAKLIDYHEKGGWRPWPITAETPGMLNHKFYSFLTMHPEQRFRANVLKLESVVMRYGVVEASDGTPSNVHGRTFPRGRVLLTLIEDMAYAAREGGSPTPSRVPTHDFALPMEYALIGEVRYTMACKASFEDFYTRNPSQKGKYIDWPGGDAVAICPGTRSTVVPHAKRVHLLVASQMTGFVNNDGGSMSKVTRIIPRILTMEGYERLVGETPPGAPNRLASIPSCATNTRAGCERLQPLYPDLLRRFLGLPTRKAPKRPPAATDAWAQFHNSGTFKAYEHMAEGRGGEIGYHV